MLGWRSNRERWPARPAADCAPDRSRSAKGILCPPAPRQPNTLADGAPQLCCARLPIALPSLCGFRDCAAGPLDGSRGKGARLGAPIRKGRRIRAPARCQLLTTTTRGGLALPGVPQRRGKHEMLQRRRLPAERPDNRAAPARSGVTRAWHGHRALRSTGRCPTLATPEGQAAHCCGPDRPGSVGE